MQQTFRFTLLRFTLLFIIFHDFTLLGFTLHHFTLLSFKLFGKRALLLKPGRHSRLNFALPCLHDFTLLC